MLAGLIWNAACIKPRYFYYDESDICLTPQSRNHSFCGNYALTGKTNLNISANNDSTESMHSSSLATFFFNPIALRRAKTPKRFGPSECNRVNLEISVCAAAQIKSDFCCLHLHYIVFFVFLHDSLYYNMYSKRVGMNRIQRT